MDGRTDVRHWIHRTISLQRWGSKKSIYDCKKNIFILQTEKPNFQHQSSRTTTKLNWSRLRNLSQWSETFFFFFGGGLILLKVKTIPMSPQSLLFCWIWICCEIVPSGYTCSGLLNVNRAYFRPFLGAIIAPKIKKSLFFERIQCLKIVWNFQIHGANREVGDILSLSYKIIPFFSKTNTPLFFYNIPYKTRSGFAWVSNPCRICSNLNQNLCKYPF